MPGPLTWIYLGSAIALGLAAAALAFGTRPQPARRCILVTLLLVSLWAFADFLASLAQTSEQMRLFAYLFAPVWSLVPFFILRAILVYMGAERLTRSLPVTLLLLAPAAGCMLLEWAGLLHSRFVPTHEQGWFFQSEATFWVYPMLAYFLLYFFAGAILTVRQARRTGESAFQGPGRLAGLVFIPGVIAGGLTNGGLSLAGWQTPYLGSVVGCAVGLITVWWIFRRALFMPLSEAQRKTEIALQVSQNRYQALMDMSPDGIIATDLHGRIHFANRRTLKALGYASLAEMLVDIPRMQDMTPAITDEAFQAALASIVESDGIRRMESQIKTRDGRILDVEMSLALLRDEQGQPAGTIGVARDISARRRLESERRELEAQVQHAQKLESLGLLAGGIAHDFNNLLSGVLGHASLARLDLGDETILSERLDKIELAAKRAAKLTHEMLAYAGRGRFVIEDVNVQQVVEDMAELLQVSVSKKVSLSRRFEEGLPYIRGDAGQIQQIIMNLITNASEAMGPEPGAIRLSAFRHGQDAAQRLDGEASSELSPGQYVCIEVEDEGRGMEPETLERMFEPFFSTKFTGRGLGLAAVQGIVRTHGGGIQVCSEPGRGTRIRVYLPVSSSSRPPAECVHGPDRQVLDELRRRGGVLVIDDEVLIREVVVGALKRVGISAWTAVDGQDGLRVFEQKGERIAAVVLDLTMPRLDGLEVFAALRAKSQQLPVLLVSGYHEDRALEDLIKQPGTGFLPKPFGSEDLLRALTACVACRKINP